MTPRPVSCDPPAPPTRQADANPTACAEGHGARWMYCPGYDACLHRAATVEKPPWSGWTCDACRVWRGKVPQLWQIANGFRLRSQLVWQALLEMTRDERLRALAVLHTDHRHVRVVRGRPVVVPPKSKGRERLLP